MSTRARLKHMADVLRDQARNPSKEPATKEDLAILATSVLCVVNILLDERSDNDTGRYSESADQRTGS